jgi:undecaprenyl-diphosphatase
MLSIFEAIILGIVQGVTEWLPVSSSGHLVLLQHLLGFEQPVIYDIVLHLGSLVVVLAVFRKDIMELVLGVLRREEKSLRYAAYLAIATIPIGIVGIFLNDLVKELFSDVRTVGVSLLFTALLLHLSQYPTTKDKKITLKSAIGIGIMQGIAILPGVSRSGSTISAGLMQGIEREEAARFSFLLFIPAILGATLVEAKNITEIADPVALGVGTLVSIIVGYLTLNFLLGIVKTGNFSKFKWYCLAVGLLILGFVR